MVAECITLMFVKLVSTKWLTTLSVTWKYSSWSPGEYVVFINKYVVDLYVYYILLFIVLEFIFVLI